MQNKEFEQFMKNYEFYNWLGVQENLFTVVQLRLRNFDSVIKILKNQFSYDYRNLMTTTTEALMREFNGIYAETHKDEISVLLPKEYTQHNRNVEKLLSLFASAAGAAFSLQFGTPSHFEAHIFPLPNEDSIYDYFRWRQNHAHKNALFTHAVTYYKKTKKISNDKAVQALSQLGYNKLIALLKDSGFNFNSATPLWHRRGVALYWRIYFKTSKDPTTDKEYTVTRRSVYTDTHLPTQDAYASYIFRKALFGHVDGVLTTDKIS